MDARTSLVRTNIIWSFALKAWSGIIYLMIVPLTLSCLGEYRNGIWLTISSLLIWIDTLDIGLGNGLRNKLAAHIAHGDNRRAKEAVSSTFFMLIMVIVPVAAVLMLLIANSDLYAFFNINAAEVTGLRRIVAAATLLVSSTFIFKFIGNVYLGLQLPMVNNLLITCGQTLALIGTFLVWRSGSHSLTAIAVVNTAAPLAVWLAAWPYTFFSRYPFLRPSWRSFSIESVKELLFIGLKFFVLQICGALLFFSSNLLISRLFTPTLVTPYQIVYRYFSLLLIIFTIVCTPFWTATTDAYERGDMEWIISASRRMRRVLLIIALLVVLMVIFSQPVYWLWINVWQKKSVVIEWPLTICMAVYIFELIYSMTFSYFLNGIGKLGLQLIFTVTAAVLFIPLAVWAASIGHSPTYLYLALIAVNLPGAVINRMQFRRIMKGKARGIWNR